MHGQVQLFDVLFSKSLCLFNEADEQNEPDRAQSSEYVEHPARPDKRGVNYLNRIEGQEKEAGPVDSAGQSDSCGAGNLAYVDPVHVRDRQLEEEKLSVHASEQPQIPRRLSKIPHECN